MHIRVFLAMLAVCLLAPSAFGQATATAPRKPLAEQPLRMGKDIEAFEAQDRLQPPPKHAVLLTGASSLRMWKDVGKALAPLPVRFAGMGQRGVGIPACIDSAERAAASLGATWPTRLSLA